MAWSGLSVAPYVSLIHVLLAAVILKLILDGREDDAAFTAFTFSLLYATVIVLYLIAMSWQWLSQLFEAVASLLASAAATFAANAGVPTSSATLALSVACLVAKLRRKDYQGASLALFFTFVSALALLLLTAPPSALCYTPFSLTAAAAFKVGKYDAGAGGLAARYLDGLKFLRDGELGKAAFVGWTPPCPSAQQVGWAFCHLHAEPAQTTT